MTVTVKDDFMYVGDPDAPTTVISMLALDTMVYMSPTGDRLIPGVYIKCQGDNGITLRAAPELMLDITTALTAWRNKRRADKPPMMSSPREDRRLVDRVTKLPND